MKPPLEGRWHGVSRDGEVASLHHLTTDTSQSASLTAPLEGSLLGAEQFVEPPLEGRWHGVAVTERWPLRICDFI